MNKMLPALKYLPSLWGIALFGGPQFPSLVAQRANNITGCSTEKYHTILRNCIISSMT